MCLLSTGGRLAAATADSLSGFRSSAVAVYGLSNRAAGDFENVAGIVGTCAVGPLDLPAICGGHLDRFPADANARHPAGSRLTMGYSFPTSWPWVPRNFRKVLLAASFVAGGIPVATFADGGTIRLSETKEAYRISAFTSPNPFRAGPVEISVLVQDADSGD